MSNDFVFIPRDDEAGDLIEGWLTALNEAVSAGDTGALSALFDDSSYWRDKAALTDTFLTSSGPEAIAEMFVSCAKTKNLTRISINEERCPPRFVERAGVRTAEAIIKFETDRDIGEGIVRIKTPEGEALPSAPKAWTLLTALDEIKGHEEWRKVEDREESAFERAFHGPNWADKRRDAQAYEDRDPSVLIVGGGHGGLTAAARLVHLGVDTLIVDRMKRIGDNWRLRYHGLKLHNQITSNTLPYMPFPQHWPTYIPKDRIANWLESYADAMEINFWTGTEFLGGSYDEDAGNWVVEVERDGQKRTLRPRHIIMATSVSGAPQLPDIPTLSNYKGTVQHSSEFSWGDQWKGKNVYVFGTGTSGHDITQDLHGSGANVTIVQRSPTLIVNIEPSAQLYDGVYVGPGPSMEDRDLTNISFPFPVMRIAHKLITDKVREIDGPLLEKLEARGFKLDFGEGGTGWPLKYRTRGGGYYFNAGCSELIADGKVPLLQYSDIDSFTETGFRLKSGEQRQADLLVLATGYKGQDYLTRQLFGDEVADRVGKVWDIDDETQELINMWMPTPQKGLWYTGGAFAQCRLYSKYLARQILADLIEE